MPVPTQGPKEYFKTVANSPQARKRARQNEDRRQRNQSARSRLRTSIKKVLRAVRAADREAATTAYREAVPAIDRAAGRGLIHKNKASRHKRRLNARIRAIA